MNLWKFTFGVLGAAIALVTLSGPAVAADRPYTEGTVSNVASIRTEPGMFDDYMAWLDGAWKKQMDAQKAAGVIVDYYVYSVTPRGPDDPDLYLVTVYKNMAALDDLRDKMEPIQQQMFGDVAQRQAATIARGKLRTQVGSQLLRKLDLK